MGKLDFKKGAFITHRKAPMVFAIFGGETFLPEKEGDPYDRSLICYYDPCYYEIDENGNETVDEVFDCDVDGKGCPWTISDDDGNWRLCDEHEKETALRLLYDIKKLAWDEATNKFRHLGPNEKLIFKDNKPAVATVPKRPTITLVVNNDWTQGEAIKPKNKELSDFIETECRALENAFSAYSTYSQSYNSHSPYYNKGEYDEYRDAWGNWYDGYD